MLHIKETYVNETQGYRFGNSDWIETFTDDPGELYRALKAEYGNARNMYRDRNGSPPVKVGWVFMGRANYEDTRSR